MEKPPIPDPDWVALRKEFIAMTPQDALTLIDSALAQLGANRDTHARLQEAVRCLALSVEAVTTLGAELSQAREQIAVLEVTLANQEVELDAARDPSLTAAPPTDGSPS
jgi:hypothetical protein